MMSATRSRVPWAMKPGLKRQGVARRQLTGKSHAGRIRLVLAVVVEVEVEVEVGVDVEYQNYRNYRKRSRTGNGRRYGSGSNYCKAGKRKIKKRQAQGIKKTAKRTRMNKEGRAGRGLREIVWKGKEGVSPKVKLRKERQNTANACFRKAEELPADFPKI